MRDYDDSPKAISCVNFGEPKSGKSYFQLTMPKPLALFETDVGSFDRALPAYEKTLKKELDIGEFCNEDNMEFLKEEFDVPKDIYVVRCPFIPDDEFRTGLGFYGYILTMNRMITRAIRAPHIQSIVIDTGTWFWEMQHHAEFLKIDHDTRQNPDKSGEGRQQLQQIEYRNPNARMAQIFREAGVYNKNLLFNCHQRPTQYRNNFGEITRTQSPIDGWSKFSRTATIVTHSSMKPNGRPPNREMIPQMDMYLSGDSLGSVNLQLDYPTWDKLIEFLEEHK